MTPQPNATSVGVAIREFATEALRARLAGGVLTPIDAGYESAAWLSAAKAACTRAAPGGPLSSAPA